MIDEKDKNSYGFRETARNMLPLLIRLRQVEKFFSGTDTLDITVLIKVVFATVIQIEQCIYEYRGLNVHSHYTVELYRILIINNQEKLTDVNYLWMKLMNITTINSKSMDFGEVRKYLDNVYYVHMFGELFPEHDRRLTLCWDGNKMTGFAVWQNMSWGVVDIVQLIRYQWFAIKWFMALVLANIAYVLNSANWEPAALGNRQWIRTYINQISNIVQDTALKMFVSRTVESINITLNSESGKSDDFKRSQEIIQENLQTLGVIDNNVSFDTMANASQTLDIDLRNLERLLHLIETVQMGLLIDLKKSSISTALEDYSTEQKNENNLTQTTELEI